MKALNKLQKAIILLYIVFVLWVSVFRVPWVLREKKNSTTQVRELAAIYNQPKYALFNGRKGLVGYAYIDYRQITVILFAGTVTAGGLFLLSSKKK